MIPPALNLGEDLLRHHRNVANLNLFRFAYLDILLLNKYARAGLTYLFYEMEEVFGQKVIWTSCSAKFFREEFAKGTMLGQEFDGFLTTSFALERFKQKWRLLNRVLIRFTRNLPEIFWVEILTFISDQTF